MLAPSPPKTGIPEKGILMTKMDVTHVRTGRFSNLRAISLVLAFALAAVPAFAGENTKSLAIELDALKARVAKLEGQIVPDDLVGTYTVNALQNELNASNPSIPQVSSYVFGGTMVFSAGGAVSFNGTAENGNSLRLGASPSVQPFVSSSGPAVFTSTWTYANGTVTVDGLPIGLSVAVGGRVLIGAGANHADGTNVLLILTRLQ
jgi:hypothetical protein